MNYLDGLSVSYQSYCIGKPHHSFVSLIWMDLFICGDAHYRAYIIF